MSVSSRWTVRVTAALGCAALLLFPGTGNATSPRPASSPAPLYESLSQWYDRINLQPFGRPDGHDMVYRISGSVMLQVPGDAYAGTPQRGDEFEHGRVLFGFEGYNIRRL